MSVEPLAPYPADHVAIEALLDAGVDMGPHAWLEAGVAPLRRVGGTNSGPRSQACLCNVQRLPKADIPSRADWLFKRATRPARAALTDAHDHKVAKGGHFAAWEQPKLFSEELRAGFKPLRKPA